MEGEDNTFQHICSHSSIFGDKYYTTYVSNTFVLKAAFLVTSTIQHIFPRHLFSKQHFWWQVDTIQHIFPRHLFSKQHFWWQILYNFHKILYIFSCHNYVVLAGQLSTLLIENLRNFVRNRESHAVEITEKWQSFYFYVIFALNPKNMQGYTKTINP